MTDESRPEHPPRAILAPRRRIQWVWLVPLGAAILAGWLGYRAWSMRGIVVTVRFDEGHGLRPGDPLRYRGIPVGEVRDITLSDDLQSIIVTAALHSRAEKLARTGTRFWVVRPQVDLGGIQGLETLVGPRYLAALPASGDRPQDRQRQFVGLESPPVVETVMPGDLEIILQCPRQGRLRAGGPVRYRGVQVGTVVSIGLAADGGAVEARVHIQQAFAQLIRQGTRFWVAGGLDAHIGLGGVSVEVDSIESLLVGSVALATPPAPDAGDEVRTGHRFMLEPEPEEAWLAWAPMVAIGSSLLPPGAGLPAPLRAKMRWKQGRLLPGARSRSGWVLQTDRGLLGPADLLQPAAEARPESVVLEVAGRELALGAEPAWTAGGLTLLPADVSPSAWPSSRIRSATEPEDAVAVADPAGLPLPLSAGRMTAQGRTWLVDRAISVDVSWHGSCVLSRRDGTLIGLLLVDDEELRVALLPE